MGVGTAAMFFGTMVAGLKVVAIFAAAALAVWGIWEALKYGKSLVESLFGSDYFSVWVTAFQSAWSTILQTFGGIADALSVGEFTLAFDIGMSAIRLLWTKGINWLSESWTDFKYLFIATFGEATQAVIDTLTNMARAVGSIIGSILDNIISQVNNVIDALPDWAKNGTGLSRIDFNAADALAQLNEDIANATRLPSERDAAREAHEQRQKNRAQENALQGELDFRAAEAETARLVAGIVAAIEDGPAGNLMEMVGAASGSFSGAAVSAGLSTPAERTARGIERLIALSEQECSLIEQLLDEDSDDEGITVA